MENRNFLKNAWNVLKGRIPLLGGVLMAWVTVLGWVVPLLASRFSLFSGEGSGIFLVFLPFLWSGLLCSNLVIQILKLDPSQHQSLGQSVAVLSSILINGAAAWAVLALIFKVSRIFQRKKTPL